MLIFVCLYFQFASDCYRRRRNTHGSNSSQFEQLTIPQLWLNWESHWELTFRACHPKRHNTPLIEANQPINNPKKILGVHSKTQNIWSMSANKYSLIASNSHAIKCFLNSKPDLPIRLSLDTGLVWSENTILLEVGRGGQILNSFNFFYNFLFLLILSIYLWDGGWWCLKGGRELRSAGWTGPQSDPQPSLKFVEQCSISILSSSLSQTPNHHSKLLNFRQFIS